MEDYTLDKYVDITASNLKEFIPTTPTWEIVLSIEKIIKKMFNTNKYKPNYSKDVFVGKNVKIDKSARIVGPAIILDNAKVEFTAFIAKNVILDENSVVGTYSEVKNSILFNTAKASHLVYVSDSLLGNEVRLGAGTIIANKTLKRGDIKIRLNSKKSIIVPSTRFGAIVGDNTKIGANCVLNPGTTLEKNCQVFPLTSVIGYHSKNSILKS